MKTINGTSSFFDPGSLQYSKRATIDHPIHPRNLLYIKQLGWNTNKVTIPGRILIQKAEQINDDAKTIMNPVQQQHKYKESKQFDDELDQIHDQVVSTKKSL